MDAYAAFLWAAHHGVTSSVDVFGHGIAVFLGVVGSEVIAVGGADCFEVCDVDIVFVADGGAEVFAEDDRPRATAVDYAVLVGVFYEGLNEVVFP